MLSITLVIIIATVVISLAAFNNSKVLNDLIFYPPAIHYQKQYYRFITSGFIHGDYVHLIFNMLSFYFFGPAVEELFIRIFDPSTGRVLYLLLYFSALIVCLLPTYAKNKDNNHYMGLGASGAVSAVIFAAIMFQPQLKIGFLFIPFIHIPGFLFGPLFLVISAYLGKKGGSNINHSAHIWGALYGVAFVIITTALFTDYKAVDIFIYHITNYINTIF